MKWIPILLNLLVIDPNGGHVAMDFSRGRSQVISGRQDTSFPYISSQDGTFMGTCRGGAVCVPFVSCSAHVRSPEKTFCKTLTGKKGVCCTTGRNLTKPFTKKDRGHRIIKLDEAVLGALNHKCRDEMSQLRSREARLLDSEEPTILLPGSASYSHFRNSRRFDHFDLNEVTNVAMKALEIAMATKVFKDREGVSNSDLELGMIQEDLRYTPLGHNCPPSPVCPVVPGKYRRIDGSCNNQYNSLWGATRTPYSRLLPPSYEDGIWAPRTSQVGEKELPSPRLVTTSLFDDRAEANQDLTLLVMQFGQFLAHEITQSLDYNYVNGSAISCCTQDGWDVIPPEYRHFACMPITLPREDNFFGGYKQGCMNFVRSVLAPREDCTLGYAQQMNKVTHFIDGSTIYGSTSEQTGELRSFEEGKLKVFNDYGRDLLPLSKDKDACLTMEQGTACFNSGDTRTNQMVTLVVLHTLFMREHNRIADALTKLNPDWNDEQIFLEARQIVIAELQVITYKEFLPVIIGESTMEEFGLNLEEKYSYSYDYDQRIQPSVINEFATAAFRFGHSMIDGTLKIYGMTHMEEQIAIPEVMFYPSQMRRKKFMDMVLSTLTTEPIQEVDSSFPEAVTKYLFRAGNPFGVDLPSLNIQRGRDHGLRPYNDYRELVGLPRFTSFSDFGPEIGPKLEKVYASVNDVDLWVGGLLEEKDGEGIVGPVFRNIIADQFSRLKNGDRYFFENDPSVNPGHFTPGEFHWSTIIPSFKRISRKKKLLYVFNVFFDVNQSGTIDRKDFELAIEKICSLRGWSSGSEQYKKTFESMITIWEGLKQRADSNKDGQVSVEEWASMWDDYAKNPENALEWQTQYLKFMFDLEDASGDGSIDVDEFTSVCSCYGLDTSECKQAFQKMAEGKKEVNYEQFVALWKQFFTSENPSDPGNFIFGKTKF